MAAAPVIVDIRRGGLRESRHHVHGIVLDASGKTVAAWGDTSQVVFPRSAIKPFQALPLLATGAAEAFRLSDTELALACASHGGQPEHVAAAGAWLDRLGLAEADLECGHHWPSHKASEHALCRAGGNPCNLHNNCSGKHLGMMTVCRHMGWDVTGYTQPDHPLQRMIFEKFSTMAGVADVALGIDGCSAPSPALPLHNIARAFVALAQDDHGRRLLSVMSAHPFYVAGDKRFDTALMQAFPARFAAKTGAEGNQAVINLATGAVLYVKAEDGNTRAALAACGHALQLLGWVDDDAAIAGFTRPVQKNWRGIVTGDTVIFKE